MARKRNLGRSKLGEQSNDNLDQPNENMETGRTNIERGDQMMGAGAHGDREAGNEGIDSPSKSGQGDQAEGSNNPRGTGHTSGTRTDKSESDSSI